MSIDVFVASSRRVTQETYDVDRRRTVLLLDRKCACVKGDCSTVLLSCCQLAAAESKSLNQSPNCRRWLRSPANRCQIRCKSVHRGL